MKLTVAIPIYNAETTLLDAIRSIFAQTYLEWELLLVDDGSTDGSLSIAESIQDPKVRVVHHAVNKGLAVRLNEIALLARGEYLARMDADDLAHPQRLKAQVDYLDQNSACCVVDTAVCSITADLEPVGIRGVNAIPTDARTAVKRCLLHHPTVMGRAEWFRKNPYDPEYIRAQDHELWTRTFADGVFGRITEPLLYLRENGSLIVKPRNYVQSQIADRKIYRHYGPQRLGWPRTFAYMTESYLKQLSLQLMAGIGANELYAQFLIDQRNHPMTADQFQYHSDNIALIRQTVVPGVCGSTPGGI